MTCNVTELRHHLGWFDENTEIYCVDEHGRVYEITRLEEALEAPILVIKPAGDATA